jgi:hypothetical protein
MKVFFFAIVQLFILSVYGQENKPIMVNTLSGANQNFLNTIYQYPSYIKGKVFFHDGSAAIAKLNYNYFTNEINFIDPKGDTLEIEDAPIVSKVVILTDTFFYYDKIFLQRINYGTSYSLLLKHTLSLLDTEQKGAFGTYSRSRPSQSITRVPTINDNNIGIDENVVYHIRDMYYISDRFNKIYPTTKKGLYNLFGKHDKQVKDFVEANNLRLNHKEDLEKLLKFANTL